MRLRGNVIEIETDDYVLPVSRLGELLQDLEGWTLRELLCDVCDVGHLTGKEELLREIGKRI